MIFQFRPAVYSIRLLISYCCLLDRVEEIGLIDRGFEMQWRCGDDMASCRVGDDADRGADGARYC